MNLSQKYLQNSLNYSIDYDYDLFSNNYYCLVQLSFIATIATLVYRRQWQNTYKFPEYFGNEY